MSELTLLHFSDTHNWDKLEVIANFVEKQKVDATLWTGDTFNFDTRNKEGIGAKLHEAYFKHTDSTELNKLINDYVQTYSQLEEKQKQDKEKNKLLNQEKELFLNLLKGEKMK